MPRRCVNGPRRRGSRFAIATDAGRDLSSPRRRPEIMASEPHAVQIRNQRYPRWVLIAENVVVGGMLVAFLVIEIVGLWLFGVRTAMYILLAAFLAILPIAMYGWFQIWDLSRPGPGRGVTARALLDGVCRGIRRKELVASVEWSALTALRAVLPPLHTVYQL